MDISDYVKYARMTDGHAAARDSQLSVEELYDPEGPKYSVTRPDGFIIIEEMESDDFFAEKEKEEEEDFDLIMDDIIAEEAHERSLCLDYTWGRR